VLWEGASVATDRAKVVRHPAVDAVLSYIKPKTVVVVRGAKGSGKSVAITHALYELLKSGVRIAGLRPVAYFVRPTECGRDDLLSFGRWAYVVNRRGVIPIVYIAYSRTTSYKISGKKREHYPYYFGNFVRTISALYMIFRMAKAVAILEVSSDFYKFAIKEIKRLERESVEVAEVDVDAALGNRREEFVEEVVLAHGGAAHREVVQQIARLEWGYALAAALAAGEPPENVNDSLGMLALSYIAEGVLGGRVREGDVKALAGLASARSRAAKWLSNNSAQKIAKTAVEYVQKRGAPPIDTVIYTAFELAKALARAKK